MGTHFCKEVVKANKLEYADQASVSMDISRKWTLYIDGPGGIATTKIRYCPYCGEKLEASDQ